MLVAEGCLESPRPAPEPFRFSASFVSSWSPGYRRLATRWSSGARQPIPSTRRLSAIGRSGRGARATSTSARRRSGRDLLRPITLHECRHTFASLLIDAGVNPKAIQEPGARDHARQPVDCLHDCRHGAWSRVAGPPAAAIGSIDADPGCLRSSPR